MLSIDYFQLKKQKNNNIDVVGFILTMYWGIVFNPPFVIERLKKIKKNSSLTMHG